VLLAINVESELVIEGGQRESLTTEACPDGLARIKTEIRNGQLLIRMGGGLSDKISAALGTSLTRPHVKYVLTVQRLTDLDIAGLTHARVDNVETERLHVKFSGPGNLSIAGLNAQRLDVDVGMPGPRELEVNGRVSEQRVSLNGMSDYRARGLESRKAAVALKGPGGHVVVRAEDALEAIIGGPGSVEYYGCPRVTRPRL
jgi:hypothetical protein